MAELTRRDLAAERRGRGATKPVRHGQLKKHRGWPSVLKFVASALAVVLVAGLSVSAYAGYTLSKKLNDIQRDAVVKIVQGAYHPRPFLLFGPPGTGTSLQRTLARTRS